MCSVGDPNCSDLREADDPVLRAVLLSYKTPTLRLPESTLFEPLRPAATNVALAEDSRRMFATHTTYQLPIGQSLHIRPGQDLSCDEPLTDVVHRFTVHRRLCDPLNARLTAWALHKEQLGKECEARLVPVVAGPGSDAGVNKTNVGGYQSFHDLFVPPETAEEDSESKRDCLWLERLVCAALDEATGGPGEEGDPYPDEAALLRPPADSSAAVTNAVTNLSGGLGDEWRPGDARHVSYAWLNVNRSADSNFMHTHQVDLWSAVYYVNEGEPNAPGSAHPTCGHMLFRCGARPAAEGGARLGPDAAPRQSYFAVPPRPGTLWLFPGSVPHTVMHTVLPAGVDEPSTPRISIGINFESAVAPLGRPWRLAPSWDEQLEAAAGRAARRAAARAAAAAAAESAPMPSLPAPPPQTPWTLTEGVAGAEEVVSAAPAPVPGAAAVAEEPGEAAARIAAEAKARAAREAEAEDSPFLMLTAEQAKDRGFGDDEEIVMPMPCSDSDDD